MRKTNTQKINLWKVESIFWKILLIISLISLISTTETYVEGGSDIRDPKWVEMIIIPFYFTIQSNFLAFLVSLLVSFKLIKSKKILRILSICMVVNLIVTFVVYWAILFPNSAKTDWLGWVRNLTLHTLTPLIAILVFIFKYILNKNQKNQEEEIKIFIGSTLHLIYPIIWLVIAIALYFILGADEKDAIYPFLKVKTHPTQFVIYVVGIASFYYGLTTLFIFLSNPKKQKVKFKNI